MDFLDPKKQKAYTIRLIIGYCLVAVALVLTTTILLYQAYGFGIDKNGQIIQNGLVFVNSSPNPAQIYLNGQRYKSDTNTRLSLPSGQHTISLNRAGYTTWKRAITVEGGSVEYVDYPLLLPLKPQTTVLKTYDSAPHLLTQSLDRRWLLVQTASDLTHFELLDLTQPKQAAKEVVLPGTVVTASQAGASEGWSLMEWSSDNKHVLLKHSFTDKNHQAAYEYILMDCNDPTQSTNLTTALGANPTILQLRAQKYDSYYLYDSAASTLATATLKAPTPQPYLDRVLAYKSYGSDMVLYMTDKNAPAGHVNAVWRQGDKSYTIHTVSAVATGGHYLLDVAQYSGDWYVAISDPSDNKAYVYKNPLDAIKADRIDVPIHILKIANADHLQFSPNFRFVLAENGMQFAVYDAEYDRGFIYQTKQKLDAPQTHAAWMDGNHLSYVAQGKTLVFDFDSANPMTFAPADAIYQPVFDPNYKYEYSVGMQPATATEPAKTVLDQTALRTPQDL